MRTRRSNIIILRAGLIGSISAWLPSRRSVDSQRGASVMVRDGQMRSGRSIGGDAPERCTGMPPGRWVETNRSLCRVMICPSLGVGAGASRNSAAREARLLDLAAAAKEEAARHDALSLAPGRIGVNPVTGC